MLVKVTYVICGVEETELFNWDSEEQRGRFHARCDAVVTSGGRFYVDASSRHRAVLMATHCKRCQAAFMSNKCPVCGWVVGTSPDLTNEDPWADDKDETPIEKGKGRFR